MNTDGELTYDKKRTPVEGFRTDFLIEISAGGTYSPTTADLAFRVPNDVTYYLGTATTVLASLKANSITIINYALEYTFSSAITLEVMSAG